MSIRAEGKFTNSDVWRGARLVAGKHLTSWYFFLIVMWASGVLDSFMGASVQSRLTLFVLPVLPIGYCWLMMFLQARRQARENPNLQGTVSYTFDDLGYVEEALHARVEVKWSGLVKWKEGRHCFAIYTNPNIASIIPKRFFRGPADVDAFRSFLQSAQPTDCIRT